MKRSKVVIEISASRLEVAVVRGRRIEASAALRHHAPSWATDWPRPLEALSTALRELVIGLNATGLPAIVIASTPTSGVTINSCQARAGAAAAESAAMLALANERRGTLESGAGTATTILRDRESKSANIAPMRHVLAVGDTDESMETVTRWVEAAGLTCEGIVPLSAVELVAAAIASADESNPDATSTVLWVGEHHSALAVGSARRLRFVRPIALGTESLVESLTRPISRRGSSQTDEPITLTVEEARSLLASHGLPDASQVIDVSRGLDGGAILPLLQPTVQRLSLEVKQSLRFGLSEAERQRTGVTMMGPGAQFPNLARHLRSHLASADQQPQDAAAPNPTDHPAPRQYVSCERGAIHALLTMSAPIPRLLPRARAEAAHIRRVRGSLRIGIAACLGLVALDGAAAWLEARRSDAAPPAEINPASAEAISNARSTELALRAVVDQHAGNQPTLGPWLATIAEAARGRVGLTSISLEPAKNQANSVLKGVAQGEADKARQNLREFLAMLSASPLVERATLQHTQHSTSDSIGEQAFEIVVSMLGIPREPGSLAATPTQEEAR